VAAKDWVVRDRQTRAVKGRFATEDEALEFAEPGDLVESPVFIPPQGDPDAGRRGD
jgi:hypothetical protein